MNTAAGCESFSPLHSLLRYSSHQRCCSPFLLTQLRTVKETRRAYSHNIVNVPHSSSLKNQPVVPQTQSARSSEPPESPFHDSPTPAHRHRAGSPPANVPESPDQIRPRRQPGRSPPQHAHGSQPLESAAERLSSAGSSHPSSPPQLTVAQLHELAPANAHAPRAAHQSSRW